MPECKGFIQWDATEVMDLLDSFPGLQFYRLDNYPALFTLCEHRVYDGKAYEPISQNEARAWAEEKIDG
jgi:hypothetical protein